MPMKKVTKMPMKKVTKMPMKKVTKMPMKRVTLENANVSDRTRKARQLLVLGKATKISKTAKISKKS
jgi:hypothetical protein